MNMAQKQIWVVDHVQTGQNMSAFRRVAGISLREIARRMKLSAPYISDLEHGRRNWTQDKLESYRAALNIKKGRFTCTN